MRAISGSFHRTESRIYLGHAVCSCCSLCSCAVSLDQSLCRSYVRSFPLPLSFLPFLCAALLPFLCAVLLAVLLCRFPRPVPMPLLCLFLSFAPFLFAVPLCHSPCRSPYRSPYRSPCRSPCLLSLLSLLAFSPGFLSLPSLLAYCPCAPLFRTRPGWPCEQMVVRLR